MDWMEPLLLGLPKSDTIMMEEDVIWNFGTIYIQKNIMFWLVFGHLASTFQAYIDSCRHGVCQLDHLVLGQGDPDLLDSLGQKGQRGDVFPLLDLTLDDGPQVFDRIQIVNFWASQSQRSSAVAGTPSLFCFCGTDHRPAESGWPSGGSSRTGASPWASPCICPCSWWSCGEESSGSPGHQRRKSSPTPSRSQSA